MKKSNIFKWLIIVLSAHILSVQTGLLHGLSGKNESLFFAIVFAFSYAAASGFIIYLSDKRWLIFIYAIADGIGVELYYEEAVPSWIKVVYFALYTFLLIYSTTLIEKNQEKELDLEELDSEVRDIIKLKKEGLSRALIAKKLNISKYKIDKLMTKYEKS